MAWRKILGWYALAMLAVTPAFAADPAMHGVEKRQNNQQERIGQGTASGELTPQETIRLEREQAGIERAKERAEADGIVTPKERVRLHKRQDHVSRDIYRKKHNNRKVQ